MSRLPDAAAVLTYLAFDYGLKRVGVAVGNSLTRQAQPVQTIAAEGDARFARIAQLVAEWRPDALVVGVPFHPDGAPHDNTQRARRFARQFNANLAAGFINRPPAQDRIGAAEIDMFKDTKA